MSSEKKESFERLNLQSQDIDCLPINIINIPSPWVQENIPLLKKQIDGIVVQIEDQKPWMELTKGTIMQKEEQEPQMKMEKETIVQTQDKNINMKLSIDIVVKTKYQEPKIKMTKDNVVQTEQEK